MKRIDVNCDMGEGVPGEEELMRWITSANIACGGHAGNETTMRATIRQALNQGLRIGAHPGYADRENFGRIELNLPAEEIARTVHVQVSAFARIAAECGAAVAHVKPHGALYNQAVRNATIAQAIADGVARWNRNVVLVGLAGSPMLDVFDASGFAVMAEAFADRRYEADGTLRPRKYVDALLRGPHEAAQQAIEIAKRGVADTICIHGDTPAALEIATAVALALRTAGYL